MAAASTDKTLRATFKEIFQIRNLPFDAEALQQTTGIQGWDSEFTYFEIEWTDGLYRVVLNYIQVSRTNTAAYSMNSHLVTITGAQDRKCRSERIQPQFQSDDV